MGFGDSIIYTPSFSKKSKQKSGKLTFLLWIGMLIVFSRLIVPMDPIPLLQVRPELCDMIVVVLGFGGCCGSVLYVKKLGSFYCWCFNMRSLQIKRDIVDSCQQQWSVRDVIGRMRIRIICFALAHKYRIYGRILTLHSISSTSLSLLDSWYAFTST